MTAPQTIKVGKRGTMVIPARLRRLFGLDEGSIAVAEEREEGILIRPAVALPLARYTKEQKAMFLLSNAVDSEDYQQAAEEVKRMGLDPGQIPHTRPSES